jgi:hypothetical protein
MFTPQIWKDDDWSDLHRPLSEMHRAVDYVLPYELQEVAARVIEVRSVPANGPHPTEGVYVRDWWMSQLGPTSTVVLQLLARIPGDMPYRLVLTDDVAARIGVARKPARLWDALDRLCKFQAINISADHERIAVRSHMETLDANAIRKLPQSMRQIHAAAVLQHAEQR